MADTDKLRADALEKRQRLEREICESRADSEQKTDMLHTLSKMWMFARDAIDELRARLQNETMSRSRASLEQEIGEALDRLQEAHTARDHYRDALTEAQRDRDIAKAERNHYREQVENMTLDWERICDKCKDFLATPNGSSVNDVKPQVEGE